MEPSFRHFYQQYRESFFAYLVRFTGDCDLAGEILQESFTRYLERYSHLTPEPRLLYAIGRNAAIDTFRQKRRMILMDEDTPGSDCDQERRLVVKQTYRRMQQALLKLTPAERDVLSLVVSGDLNYREIGEMIGITEANVKVRVHRARVKLKNLMKKEYQ